MGVFESKIKSSLLWQITSATSESSIVLYIIAAQFWDLRARTIAADSYCIRLDLHSFTKRNILLLSTEKSSTTRFSVAKQTKKNRWFGTGRFYPIPLIFSPTIASSARWSTFFGRNGSHPQLWSVSPLLCAHRFSFETREANAQVDESYKQSLRLYFLRE